MSVADHDWMGPTQHALFVEQAHLALVEEKERRRWHQNVEQTINWVFLKVKVGCTTTSVHFLTLKLR